MKSHVLILNGPEKRDFIIEKCLKVCIPHFDQVSIIQNGKIPNHTNPIIDSFTVHSSDEFIPFEEAYNILASTVPIGDRFLVLDSDEIPTKDMIQFVTKGNWSNFNMISVPFKHHCISNDGKIYHIIDSTGTFSVYRAFVKEEGLSVVTHEGTHQVFVNKNQRVTTPLGFINHIKHDFASLLSFLTYALSLPKSQCIHGEDLAIIDEIRIKFGITPSFIYKNFSNKMLMKEISVALIDLQNQQVAKGLDFILSTDKDLAELYRYDTCLKDCCNYE